MDSPPTHMPDLPSQTPPSDDDSLPPTVDIQTQLAPQFDSLTTLLHGMSEGLKDLQSDFDSKIKYDKSKDITIDALHRELQNYRDDLVFKHMRALVTDLITLHDDLDRMMSRYSEGEEAGRDLSGIRGDIVEMLARNGIEVFTNEADAYDGAFQKPQKPVPTENPELDQQIAERLYPGFRYGERIVRPEIVRVYKYVPTAS